LEHRTKLTNALSQAGLLATPSLQDQISHLKTERDALKEAVAKLSVKDKRLARRRVEVTRMQENASKAKVLTHFVEAGAERVRRKAAFLQVISRWRSKRLASCVPKWTAWKRKVGSGVDSILAISHSPLVIAEGRT
jgi:hypothetical protein